MARTEAEIRASLIESLQTTNRSIDVRKGPVYDFLLKPVPVELEKTEADVERVRLLSTLQLDTVATEDEVNAMATSFSIRLGGGRASRTTSQIFFTFTAPVQDIPIERGTLVSSVDRRYTYFVTERQILPAATADNYFNPATRRYEIATRCEATSTGPEFDLPATRVSRLITTIEGLDGTVNLSDYSGGSEAETLNNSVDRIRAKFAGLDPETGGGIKSDVRNFDAENVLDVSLVYSKDRRLFERRSNRPAIDCYISGEDLQPQTDTFIATTATDTFTLTTPPVRSVTGVTVNGVGVDFTLLNDTTNLSASARAVDTIVLAAPVIATDVIIVDYQYNALVADTQTRLFDQERPFDTDVLSREARRPEVTVKIDATILASTDPARASAALEAALYNVIETDRFGDVLEPEVLRQTIKDDVAGIATLRFVEFHRTERSVLDVETVTLEKNEIARIDQAALVIGVRR